MFVPLHLDVGGKLKAGSNTLAVCFTPPALAVKDTPALPWAGMGDPTAGSKRNVIRKAQFGWGWDWGPVLPTVGIWKAVELAVQPYAVLGDVQFTTLSLGKNNADARVRIDAAVRGVAHGLKAEVTLQDPSGATVLQEVLPVRDGTATVEATIAKPALWWTNDLGRPDLYTLRVRLLDGDAALDSDTRKVGIRTIAIDQSPDPDEPGTTFFRFVLNGIPIFARGACWIPASSYVGALTEKDYRWQIEDAAAGNMNMLRIWGGGIYEHDAFYNLCDANGVLVWQDFLFACAPYPDRDPAFVASVDTEVRYQIARLRHHPSIAVWCGNNENQWIHTMTRKPDGALPPLDGAHLYNEVMPKAVAELDPTTPYWPGSPDGGPHPNSMRAGDVHDWTVWHGIPPVPDDRPIGKLDRSPEGISYVRYAENMARFVSEYGIHASPALETLKRALPADQLTYRSPGMENLIKDRPKDKVNALLTTVTGIPETIQQYVDFTQITQAEGLKFAIEHFRRRMPHCSGSLIWQFNDCWPCVSWSILDYNGFAKAGYFYTRRAYAPVLASFKKLDDGAVELWITNETQSAFDDEMTIELGRFAGGALWRENARAKMAANTSGAVWRGDAAKIGAAADRYLHVTSDNAAVFDNRLFFAPIKDLVRPDSARPEVKVVQQGPHELAVTITAPDYLYFTHLIVPHGATRFSDNHFDLVKGQSRTVTVRNPEIVLKPEDVTVRVF
jgi:beta-mannosidase